MQQSEVVDSFTMLKQHNLKQMPLVDEGNNNISRSRLIPRIFLSLSIHYPAFQSPAFKKASANGQHINIDCCLESLKFEPETVENINGL